MQKLFSATDAILEIKSLFAKTDNSVLINPINLNQTAVGLFWLG